MIASYEAKYWGLNLFRMDIGGSGIDKSFTVEDYGNGHSLEAISDGAMFVGFYPVQLKGHIPFWVMQAEAVFGVGFAYHKLTADIASIGDHEFSRIAFSLNFDVGLKYFFSEESFVFASYDFQKDIEKSGGKSSGRHGMTIGFGYQLPILMRQNIAAPDGQAEELEDAQAEELNEDHMASDVQNHTGDTNEQ